MDAKEKRKREGDSSFIRVFVPVNFRARNEIGPVISFVV